MSSEGLEPRDGSAVLRAFEQHAARACADDASPESILEAAAMGVAVAVLDLLDRAPTRERVVSRARKALLGAASLRNAAEDEDARDAIDLAIEQARRGTALLGGAALSTIDGAPTHEPSPYDLARLLRGELDGHAAADVALRLHRSGLRDRYAAFLPARPTSKRIRLAADSAPSVRDPSAGRSLGSEALGAVSLEAFVFEDGVIAIYAEPPIGLALTSIDVPLATRVSEASGYLELAIEGHPERVTLVLGDGERSVSWTLVL